MCVYRLVMPLCFAQRSRVVLPVGISVQNIAESHGSVIGVLQMQKNRPLVEQPEQAGYGVVCEA